MNSTNRARLLLTTDSHHVLFRMHAGMRLNYRPFGLHGITGIGYNGEWHESLSSIQLLGNGFRGYNSTLMRFMSPDSFSPFTPDLLNAYAYCLDPINYADPSGHFSISKWFGRLFGSTPKKQPLNTHSTDSDVLIDFFDKSAAWQVDKTLYIDAHGSRSHILLDGRQMNPDGLVAFIRERNYQTEHVYLIACHLADTPVGKQFSFAQQLSNKLGTPVTAFHGVVQTFGPRLYQGHAARGDGYTEQYRGWRQNLGPRVKTVHKRSRSSTFTPLT